MLDFGSHRLEAAVLSCQAQNKVIVLHGERGGARSTQPLKSYVVQNYIVLQVDISNVRYSVEAASMHSEKPTAGNQFKFKFKFKHFNFPLLTFLSSSLLTFSLEVYFPCHMLSRFRIYSIHRRHPCVRIPYASHIQFHFVAAFAADCPCTGSGGGGGD